jgi:hypothetical protein
MASTEHETITAAGWTYRMNERGWVIYRDPRTGTWYTRSDAMAIVGGASGGRDPRDRQVHVTQA